jgi:hypothetical protein
MASSWQLANTRQDALKIDRLNCTSYSKFQKSATFIPFAGGRLSNFGLPNFVIDKLTVARNEFVKLFLSFFKLRAISIF